MEFRIFDRVRKAAPQAKREEPTLTKRGWGTLEILSGLGTYRGGMRLILAEKRNEILSRSTTRLA
jgi:hypothetical protein